VCRSNVEGVVPNGIQNYFRNGLAGNVLLRSDVDREDLGQRVRRKPRQDARAHADLSSDKDCTLACIKSGSKYVLVSKGKVFQIDNQNLDDLQKYAGQSVALAGKLTGESIEVTSIVAK